MNKDEVLDALRALSSEDRAKTNAWFFKTGKGECHRALPAG